MATNATVSTGGCLPFSARYVKEVQPQCGTEIERWLAKVPVGAGGIKKSKKYSIGRYPTQAEAIFAVEKFLDDSATLMKQSRQLKAGKNARGIMLLKCKNLALRMKAKALEGELALLTHMATMAVEEAEEEGSAAFELAMETAGEDQEKDAARLAACEEKIARQQQEIADLKLDRVAMCTAVKTAQTAAAAAVWNPDLPGGNFHTHNLGHLPAGLNCVAYSQHVTDRTPVREARRKAAEEGRHWAAASCDTILENGNEGWDAEEEMTAEDFQAFMAAKDPGYDGSAVYLGSFDTEEEAARAYDVWAREHNLPVNFPQDDAKPDVADAKPDAKEGKEGVCVRCENARGTLDSAGHCVLCVSAIKIENTVPFTFNDEW